MIIGTNLPFKVGSRQSAFHVESNRQQPFVVLREVTRQEWLDDEETWTNAKQKERDIAKTKCVGDGWYYYEVSVD